MLTDNSVITKASNEKNPSSQIKKEKPQKYKKGKQSHWYIQTAFSTYRVKERLGKGSNGIVYVALDDEDNNYAIKLMPIGDQPAKRKRLKNEVFFCEQAKHPNIIRLIDHGYTKRNGDEYAFYIMPVYQETLRAKMEKHISPKDAITILYGILDGLNYAHNEGVIHRDIKPENILFEAGSVIPIICDFGIAHFSEEYLATPIETRQNDKLANFQYAAPEQRNRTGKICPATDLYAVGLILNEMFTGQIPQASGYLTRVY